MSSAGSKCELDNVCFYFRMSRRSNTSDFCVYIADKMGSKIMPDKVVSITNLYVYFSVFYILLSHTNLKPHATYFKSVER